MNKEKDERKIKMLVERDEGVASIKRLYGYKCGHCNNDLIQPYNFCRFCGYRVKEG